MSHGLLRIESGELLLSNRLLREVHELLMSGVRGGDKAPGEFRRSQNWRGGTRPGNARFETNWLPWSECQISPGSGRRISTHGAPPVKASVSNIDMLTLVLVP